MLKDALQLLETLLFVSCGYAWLWRQCCELTNNEYSRALLLVVGYNVIEQLLSAPLSAYQTFVIEERHGFNKQTLALFAKDLAKSFAITLVLVALLVPCVMWIVAYFGDAFVLYLWLFLSCVLLLLMWLAPAVIMPLCYKCDARDEEAHKGLKAALDALADGLAFPLKKIFVMDGSTRSSHSNAFQYGFCRFETETETETGRIAVDIETETVSNKRIVLFDTLLAQMSKEEIVAVMCHELGHWSHSHTLKGLAMTEAQLLVTFLLLHTVYANERFFAVFGFGGQGQPIIVGMMLFGHLLAPVSVALSFAHNYLTRSWEYQADAFAAGLNHSEDLYNALVVLFKENKAKLDPDPLYEAYHHNHPSAIHRLDALRKLKDKSK